MRKIKIITIIGAVVLLMATATTAFAASAYKTPAEAVAGLTNKSVESVVDKRADGETYGEQAKDAGKLDEFKTENYKLKEDVVNQRVKDGTMTKAEGDAWLKDYKERQAECDGTGNGGNGTGQGRGMGFGGGNGHGGGNGQGNGQGGGMGCVNYDSNQ